MKKSYILYLIPLLVLFIIAISVMFIMHTRQEHSSGRREEPAKQVPKQESILETVPVTLFFQDPVEDFLVPERRNIYATNILSDRAKQTIIELMRGAATGGLSTVPKDVTLREIYILEDGTTYVDFSREFELNVEGGSSAQLMQIYSVVNSLTYNFQEIERVAILIDGVQKESFGGHIYSGGFFREKLSIVKFPESEPSEEKEIKEAQIA